MLYSIQDEINEIKNDIKKVTKAIAFQVNGIRSEDNLVFEKNYNLDELKKLHIVLEGQLNTLYSLKLREDPVIPGIPSPPTQQGNSVIIVLN